MKDFDTAKNDLQRVQTAINYTSHILIIYIKCCFRRLHRETQTHYVKCTFKYAWKTLHIFIAWKHK